MTVSGINDGIRYEIKDTILTRVGHLIHTFLNLFLNCVFLVKLYRFLDVD